MMNMLGDRLQKVSKDFQFRSPFESKGRRPIVVLSKALALMKKLNRTSTYIGMCARHYTGHILLYFIVTIYILITREYDSSV
jgi:hypothetical protein